MNEKEENERLVWLEKQHEIVVKKQGEEGRLDHCLYKRQTSYEVLGRIKSRKRD